MQEQLDSLQSENDELRNQIAWYKTVVDDTVKDFLKDPMRAEDRAVMMSVAHVDPSNPNGTIFKRHVFYNNNVNDADRNNDIGPKEEDNQFLILMGQELNNRIFDKIKTWDTEQMNTLAGLQEIMINDQAPLFAFIYAATSGRQALPTRDEFCTLSSFEQRGVMSAYVAYCHCEMAFREPGFGIEPPPYQKFNTMLIDAFGPLPSRLIRYQVRMGHHQELKRTKDGEAVVLEASTRRMMHVEPGTVTNVVIDNW